MAKLVKTPMMGWEKINKSVLGIPESTYDTAFDSTFERSVDSNKNCVLRITLRICYRQINPWQITAPMMRAIAAARGISVSATESVGSHGDANETPHLIKEWGGPDWTNFINAVKAQAKLWNGRFWLIPPDDFALFDIVENSWTAKSGKTTTRPNIKCEFNFEIAYIPSYAHTTVDVVNLLGPGFFRSHSTLYNSSDTNIRSMSFQDMNSHTVNTNHPVIAHEIGHSLGLPHIGVSRNLAQCGLAIVLSKNFHDTAIPAIYKGGSNAYVCYGPGSSAGDIDNIMGAGSQFSQENAKPWLDRLPHHLNLSVPEFTKTMMSIGKWKVSMSEALPMSLVGF